jgi:hypothetical protein
MVVDGNVRLVGGRQTANREVRRVADLPPDGPKTFALHSPVDKMGT